MEWKTEPLGNIAFMTSGGTPSRKNLGYYTNGTIPWVRSGELENGAIRDTEIKITQAGLNESSAKIFPKGTLLIALYGATIGKLAYLDIDACTNQAVCGIFENDKVTLKYLYYYLLFQRPNLVKQGIGGAQPNISQTILKKLIVHYPVDKVEQMRIVARIEELFSELDNGVETLRKTKQHLAVYRQAVVKAVLDAHCVGANVANIGEVCHDVKVGIVIKPTQYYVASGGVRAFRNANVRRNYIEDDDWAMISLDGHERNSRSIVHAGDVLVARSGVNLGMACAVPEQYDGYNAIDVVIAVPKQDRVLSRYLAYYTNSPYGISTVKRNQRGVAQGHLNTTVYQKLQILLPPIGVQKSIIEEIEAQLSSCDSIEKTVDTALQQADAMRQGILKRSFSK